MSGDAVCQLKNTEKRESTTRITSSALRNFSRDIIAAEPLKHLAANRCARQKQLHCTENIRPTRAEFATAVVFRSLIWMPSAYSSNFFFDEGVACPPSCDISLSECVHHAAARHEAKAVLEEYISIFICDYSALRP